MSFLWRGNNDDCAKMPSLRRVVKSTRANTSLQHKRLSRRYNQKIKLLLRCSLSSALFKEFLIYVCLISNSRFNIIDSMEKQFDTQKQSIHKWLKYIIAGVIVIIVAIVFVIFAIDKDADTRNKNIESLDDKEVELISRGDSIAALMAAIDKRQYSVLGTYKDIKMEPGQAEQSYNMLSALGRDMISKDRFIEVYTDYFCTMNGSYIPENLKENLWYLWPQLDIYQHKKDIDKKNNRFWAKLYNGKYNCDFRRFQEKVEKHGITENQIESLVVIDIPRFKNTLDSINSLPAEAFKQYETQYGKWDLSGDYFYADINGKSEGCSKLNIKLMFGKIVIESQDFDEVPEDIGIEVQPRGSYESFQIKGTNDGKKFIITNAKEISKFLNSCIEGYDLKFLFLDEGASHYGWFDYSLKGLDGAWSAYRAIN